MSENAVVGDMMAGRLADSFVAFAMKPKTLMPSFSLHLPGHGVYIIAIRPTGQVEKIL